MLLTIYSQYNTDEQYRPRSVMNTRARAVL